jgi:hypothetical protein
VRTPGLGPRVAVDRDGLLAARRIVRRSYVRRSTSVIAPPFNRAASQIMAA